jgi:antitoxin component YwqK of YwqJK toxin-antitoxin module
MSETMKKEELVNNSNQPQNQKPFDVVMNENYLKNLNEGSIRTPFVPIVKEQSVMDKVIKIESEIIGFKSLGYRYFLESMFPNTLLEVKKDDEGNLTSVYVLYLKGGKLFKVVSQKDYGVIKSRMELKNGKYIPYEKCDLIPYDGTIEEYDSNRLVKSISYKNGVKDGESITYYVDGRNFRNEVTNEWEKEFFYEKTTYKNGKKNGEYENTKYGTKGNYINNKKNGVWNDSYKNICNSLSTSYQSKYDLSKYDVKRFIGRNFGVLSDYDFDTLDRVGRVFYVNEVLNGDFNINGWDGKFELGLPNGVIKRVESNRWKDVIETKLLDNGLIVSDIHYDGGDREEYEEIRFTIISYEDGLKTNSIKLSTKYSDRIPSELTSQTNQFLTEDIFYTTVKNGFNQFSLEEFLEDFIVIDYTNWNTDDYGSSTISDKVMIKPQTLDYGIKYGHKFDEYLIEECGYPHFKVEERTEWNGNIIKNYTLLTSEDYYYKSDYQPFVYSLVKSGESTKLLINGELIDETINRETNPTVLEFQKEVLQNLSEKMSSSYELEIKREELEKQREEEQKQKEREEKGLSINSFPID